MATPKIVLKKTGNVWKARYQGSKIYGEGKTENEAINKLKEKNPNPELYTKSDIGFEAKDSFTIIPGLE